MNQNDEFKHCILDFKFSICCEIHIEISLEIIQTILCLQYYQFNALLKYPNKFILKANIALSKSVHKYQKHRKSQQNFPNLNGNVITYYDFSLFKVELRICFRAVPKYNMFSQKFQNIDNFRIQPDN